LKKYSTKKLLHSNKKLLTQQLKVSLLFKKEFKGIIGEILVGALNPNLKKKSS